ncbi:protein SENSITIVITY TO RED LIGHT REDUCED 1 [Coffea eugenioides]|uniref:protein SENSITIVITY TO RED LIGHT REDUCED 1 n=1 Tax=Coffea eugenioides TaxID=49369 RepID=UPI000F60D16F|nr:protein SENSITIVITY TO RED LIGHT REDUCED 1 [Coffea eugenioides]XP_027171072.1 protein SENSITIVITY TO RED LIGHT REDUCED 1 [Coffea eugenioides]XP_027171152.1 protein SENSITIVITY TO RED LIGHT REDUCED 1 [Coffea eugenioides]XP_027171228.1 protein SENSITIVITY TO RED LIGHT REDUCED 1 [Coffea eugenioides]
MAASAKTLSLEKPNPPAEDWKIVLPRRGKQKRQFRKTIESELQKPGQSWSPIDDQSDPENESKLMQKMLSYVQKLESSQFYQAFIDQIQSHEMSDHLHRVSGSEEKLQMVIYGIGSIESYEPPRLQLSLAILMKRKFTWIGDVEVFDPVLSLTESKVLSALGCSVLSFNEQGRRQALKPTLFFMPHCEAGLYDNLLQANWEVNMLNQIVLFGNSFEAYEQFLSVCKDPIREERQRHIMAIRRFTKEFAINATSDDYFQTFHSSSWHFFRISHDEDLQNC